jgi:hypothetical protein
MQRFSNSVVGAMRRGFDRLEAWQRRRPPICDPWSKGAQENASILRLRLVE